MKSQYKNSDGSHGVKLRYIILNLNIGFVGQSYTAAFFIVKNAKMW